MKQQKDFMASYMPQSLSEASQLVSSETAEAHALQCTTTLIPDILSATHPLWPYLLFAFSSKPGELRQGWNSERTAKWIPTSLVLFFSCRWESKAHICSGWWRLLRDSWSHLTVHSWELLSMVWALCKHGWPQLPKALHLFLRGRWNCPEFSQKKNPLKWGIV